ncbi:SGNH/GDSL hydrolase family protein [Rhizobium sp. PP-CC-3G-465]|uniref:SGNH/GDSL hydrolase family protein n=1 Tax=Rhizobium sp. PP-CC-3G-465 TaxID=2135648 RepID=UPI00104A038E|nr:GDSL-like lipase/acylhydrolase family protein [Rhizobium sp. PP-CC-3G-465]
MPIGTIANGEGGASVRAKLNAAVDRGNEVENARSGSASLADRLGVILDAAIDQSDAVLTYLGGVVGAQATASQQRDTALGQRIDAILQTIATDAEVAAAISTALAPYATDADLSAAVAAIQDAVSTAASKANVALAASNNLLGQAFARPGDARALFSSALTGSALSRAPITAGIVAPSADLGSVLRIRGVDTDDVSGYVDVARRIDFALDPGRTYLVTATVDRNVDPSDPANNAVEIRWQNLNANKAGVSNVRLGGALLPTVAGGPLRVSFMIGKAGAPGELVYIIPPSAVYGLPLVRIYGNGAETDIASIDVRDVTDDVAGGTELSELTARISAEEEAREQLAEVVSDLGLAVDNRVRFDVSQALSAEEEQRVRETIGLGDIDNTPDSGKPVSEAQLAEFNDRTPKIEHVGPARPVIVTDDVAVMYINQAGEVGLPSLSPETRREAVKDVSVPLSPTLRVPFIYSDQGGVVAWLTHDGIDLALISDALRMKIVGAQFPKVEATGQAQPLIVSDEVAIMYLDEEGRVGLPVLAPETKREATSDLAPAISVHSVRQPLLYSDKGGVAAFLDEDGIDFPKVSKALKAKLLPRQAMSSGQSLHRVRSKIARMKFGISPEKIKVLVIGDSWVQGDPISRGLMTEMTRDFPISDTGFMSSRGTAFAVALTSATLVTSGGWTITNATDGTTYPFGTGPDGQVLYTTATNQTISVAGLKATSIKILRNQFGGKWRYRVDGGSYTVVTDATGGAQAAITISGLADVDHTLDIDTVGNTGTVSFAGLYAERNVSGIEINRFGAGGMDAARMQFYIPNMQLAISLIQPDLVITVLGTNDAGSPVSTPDVYADVLGDLTTLVKSIVPDCGVLHVIPPVNAGAVLNPLSAYRDAIIDLCETNGSEYLSLVDTFGSYDQGNALFLWSDTLHLNAIGGLVVGKTINDNFIKL